MGEISYAGREDFDSIIDDIFEMRSIQNRSSAASSVNSSVRRQKINAEKRMLKRKKEKEINESMHIDREALEQLIESMDLSKKELDFNALRNQTFQ